MSNVVENTVVVERLAGTAVPISVEVTLVVVLEVLYAVGNTVVVLTAVRRFVENADCV